MEAIVQLPAPENVGELRQVLGMINYLGKYVPNLSAILQPMSSLLKSDVVWMRGPGHQQAFDKAKELLATSPVLAFYDANKPTIVSSDTSGYGIGGGLLQDQGGGELRPVAYCSRTLTEGEM